VTGQFVSRFDHVDNAMRRAGEFLPGVGGVAGEFVARAKKQSGHVKAGRGQKARGHHAVAAVVAPATENSDAARLRKLLARESRNRRRGRAHEIERENVEALGGQAVASLHLGSGKNVHETMVLQGAGALDLGSGK
jgi:hypothetical protein